MCAGKPSLSALGLGGNIFPLSVLLLWWLLGQLGTASIGAYPISTSAFNCLALVHGCPNSVDWLYWSHWQNSFTIPPTAATVPGSCQDVLASPWVPLAPWEVCNNSSELENCFLFIAAGWKAQTNQQKCPPKSQSILINPSVGSFKEGCASPDPSCVNPSHRAYSISSKNGNFCPCPAQSTDKAMYICSVYYAEDADWH